MTQYARFVATEDVVFTGEGFVRQWREVAAERPHYAYIIPEPGDATWPLINVWMSREAFSVQELRQLCRYDTQPLLERQHRGETPCGFAWCLTEVAMEAVTESGAAMLQEVEHGIV